MKRVLWGGVLAGVVLLGACQLLLPERFAVNAPIAHMLFSLGTDAPSIDLVRERLHTAEGFRISLYAEGIPNARMLRALPTGDLLVSNPRSGELRLVERDADGDGRADGVRVLASELNRPHGIELHDGWLYIAETDAVVRIRFDSARRELSGELERLITDLPGGGNHWSRTLRIGPDEKLYLSVGSSCNVCIEQTPKRAAMLRYELDGSGEEIYATGLRNSVGFDWRPGSNELFATDNGRDLLGDDFPPCELNRIVQGGFYGWPFANGDRVPDPDLGAGRETEIAKSRAPVHDFRAHNAPLGMTFIRGTGTASEYRGAAIVALHGSWNRTKKDGYKVVSLHWRDDGSIEERDFVSGFERDGKVIGRPVDVVEAPDGALYISDDYAGVIWRVAYGRSEGDEAMPQASRSPQQRPSGSGLEGDVTQGAQLYDEYPCRSCHDPERAEAGAVPAVLRGLSERYSDASLAEFLATPPPPMPAYPMSGEERAALAAFLRKQFP